MEITSTVQPPVTDHTIDPEPKHGSCLFSTHTHSLKGISSKSMYILVLKIIHSSPTLTWVQTL